MLAVPSARADDANTTWHTEPPSGVDPSNALFRLGYLDATLPKYKAAGVDPTGVGDSTAGLQLAVDDARDRSLVVLLPAGTYRVGKTLELVQLARVTGTGEACGVYPHSVVLVGSTAGMGRPLIRLSDGSAGFGSAGSPKPLVRLSLDMGGDPDCAFYNGVRGIDLDLGGNPGAIGFEMGAAQSTFLEDTRIVATGAYAGVTSIPGRGMATVNVEVVGGRYGFKLSTGNPSLGGSLVGVRLRDQTVAALSGAISRGMSVVGLEIEKATGPAIDVAGGGLESGLFVVDARITVGGGRAVDNPDGAFLHMRNVYVMGAAEVVASKGRPPIAGAAGWVRVAVYSFCPLVVRSGYQSWNLVDGARNQDEIASTAVAPGGPPADLLSRHAWARLPSFEDADAKNVLDTDIGAKGDGVADDAPAIQNAIDGHDKIFLPRGAYRLGSTVVLGARTRLFGVPGGRSRIVPLPGWTPATQAWMIDTVDDPSAVTYLADVWVMPRGGPTAAADDRLSIVRWRAGRASMLKDVSSRPPWNSMSELEERQLFLLTGSGGGRWYRWGTEAKWAGDHPPPHPGFRQMLVRGTREPLTFYGFNPEHAKTSPFVELRDAHNVRIFGTKGESTTIGEPMVGTTSDVLHLVDARNVLVGMFVINPDKRTTGSALVRVSGTSAQIQVAGALRQSLPGSYALLDAVSAPPASVAGDEFLALYRSGGP